MSWPVARARAQQCPKWLYVDYRRRADREWNLEWCFLQCLRHQRLCRCDL